MAVPHPIPAPLAELIAERFRLLGEPQRIRILDRLREGPLTVQELTAQLEMTQQNASKHLGLLHRAGILARERDGNFVRYRIADAGVYDLCEHVCGRIQERLEELRSLMDAEVSR